MLALAAIGVSLSDARAQSAPTIAVAFSPTSVIAGDSSNLTFTLANPNSATQLTGVSVQATLPANLSVTGNAGTCTSPGTTISTGGGSFSIANTTLNANSSCTVTLTMTSSVPGTYSVTTGNISSTGPASVTGTTATTPTPLTVTVPSAPTISAAFSPTSIASNGISTSTLTLTISNPNASTQLTGVAVAASSLPVNLNGSSPGTTCSSGTATYNGGSRSLSLSGGVLNASASCTVTLAVSTSTAGTFSYTTGVVSASGPASVTGTTATTATPLTAAGPTATQVIASVTGTSGHAVTPFTPVTGSGGTGPLSYSVSPTLPTGLSFNTANGQITGTPSAASSTTTYTVTVTDANNATASRTFSLTINGPVTATQAVPATSLTQNRAATSFTPVTGAGGTGTLSFGISPALPAGLSFNTTNGQITGTPTVTSAATTYTVTVTDSNSATASNTFSLTVNNAVTATQTVASAIVTANHAVPPFTPITGGGGTSPLSYSVSPSLPSGLTLSTSTGQITGTPTTASAAATYTVTVTDANGATASNTFSLTVNGAVTATQAVPSTTMTVNHAATPFTPVTGGGGTGTLTYGVSPTLPAGLSFNTSNGQITGTPTTTGPATTYTVTITDASSATATNTFSLTVNGAVTAVTAIPSRMLTINQVVTPFTPVTGSGGTGALTYGISPVLPTGLSFSTATGTISGTPTTPQSTTTYTVTVTDTNSASTSSTFTLAVGQVATTVALTSSQNPSQSGQPVTFTATVVGTGATPTGTVTFNDGGTSIGTATLTAGAATFTTSVLAVGSHTITASYGGSAIFLASTSPALAQTVSVPADSVKLRALQVNVTKTVAQNSGIAISSAIDDAISDGFSEDGGAFLKPSAGRMRFNFSADPRDSGDDVPAAGSTASGSNALADTSKATDSGTGSGRGRSRVNDAFAAIDQQMPKKALPKWHEEKQWLLWADVRGSGVDRWNTTTTSGTAQATQASLYGQQINALMGLTYKATPSFLVGFIGGWETFSYTEQDINGKLKGDGWTVGTYVGWKITPTLRYDATVTYSGIGYNSTAGTAQGNFDGQRWMFATGLTGMYKAYGFLIEPSARVYALWEHQNAYVDSLGTQQGTNDFASGRASGGLKAAYPLAWLDSGVVLTPYLGVYGDYYFNKEDAAAIVATGGVPLASTPLLDGWSARLTGGLGVRLPSGGAIAVGGELGGFGSDARIWTLSAKAQVPFSAQ